MMITDWIGRLTGSSDRRDSSEVKGHASQLLASLLTMAWFVEARDPYTGGHLWRVSRYARQLADSAGIGDAAAARIALGGFLHDLGKVGVPDSILRKTQRLTDEEYSIIKTHPEVGMRMLAGHPLAALVREAVLMHHERIDGRGYPQGMQADSIPVGARIVGICDAFDAMTSYRPYRKGMDMQVALNIICENKGSQFDANLADLFIKMGESGELDHVMGHSDNGIPMQSCPMCGPTLVVRREQIAGDRIYCRNCSGEFELVADAGTLNPKPTGRMGNAAALEPEADIALIRRTVEEAVRGFPELESLVDDRFAAQGMH